MHWVTLLFNVEDYMLPCLTRQFLGFDCPGCGLQRSVTFLLQGDFVAAFKMYPAIYPMLLLFSFIVIKRFVSIRFENTITFGLLLATFFAIFTNFILKFI
ncbi:DUF2752 domain-containing protein [Pricia sp.]|uniref:DUF2752 domain-containing protein n=1 Tax=Pricia sp. TaxID=2268138 RepID=UPI0035930CBD